MRSFLALAAAATFAVGALAQTAQSDQDQSPTAHREAETAKAHRG